MGFESFVMIYNMPETSHAHWQDQGVSVCSKLGKARLCIFVWQFGKNTSVLVRISANWLVLRGGRVNQYDVLNVKRP